MEYRVVEHHKLSELVLVVNGLIEKGWVPQGGVSFSHRHTDSSGKYVQAMVIFDKTSELVLGRSE